MKNKEWIEDVLNSAQNIQRAEAPDGLWNKIQQEIAKDVKVVSLVPKRTIWLAAASVALLVIMNWVAIHSYQSSSTNKSKVDTLIEQYGLN